MSEYARFVRNYLLSSSLYHFVFAYAIYNVLFSVNGLSTFEISLLITWWALWGAVFEIPSGALADYWNRKKLLVIAALIKSLCFIIWYFAYGSFYLYALGFFVWSFGASLRSGTSEALLYDTLVTFKKKKQYEAIVGKEKSYYYISVGTSIFIGGLIAHYNLNSAIIYSVIPLLFSALFASFLKDTPKKESTHEVEYLKYIKVAYQEIKQNKILFTLFVYLCGVFILGVLDEFDQLYYQFVNLPLYAFGIVGLVWSTSHALGSYYAHKLTKKWIFFVFPLLSGILFVVSGLYPSIPIIGVLLFASFLLSPLEVLIDAKIQHSIKSTSRATIISASTLLITLFAAVVTPLFGLVSRIWDVAAIYTAAGIMFILFAIWSFRNRIAFE